MLSTVTVNSGESCEIGNIWLDVTWNRYIQNSNFMTPLHLQQVSIQYKGPVKE